MVFVGEMTEDGEDWIRYDNEERVSLSTPIDNIIRVGGNGSGSLYAEFDSEGAEGKPSFTVEFQKEVSQ